MQSTVPSSRVSVVNQQPVLEGRALVLYWMVAARRPHSNFALERAADWSRHLGKPLLILEALRCDYPWASDRFHRFVIDGMDDNRRAFERAGAAYYPYVEDEKGAGRGLLAAVARHAAVVVTDEFPTFFLPRMVAAAGETLDVRLEAVDSNGLLPLAAAGREHATAYSFRRFLQRELIEHLDRFPLDEPCCELPSPAAVPTELLGRWPAAQADLLSGEPGTLARLPIDHEVGVVRLRGGESSARTRLQSFVREELARYGDLRNRPDDGISSGLSPYLHFGHISSHDVFREVMLNAGWTPEDVNPPANGRRSGWWGVSNSAEAFLDQLVTWRELGFNFCRHRWDHDQWGSLPEWARKTLELHARDSREYEYSLDEFRSSETHDELWNAAQTQLRRDGTIHNYLRMLWGKKILEWTPHPRDARAIMFELNNRYALDGRDPNSVTGIMWVLGRHDRAWGPERAIFGKVRYMSSANTRRKVPVRRYLEEFS